VTALDWESLPEVVVKWLAEVSRMVAEQRFTGVLTKQEAKETAARWLEDAARTLRTGRG
jgi:hypothetical protein